MRRLTGRGLLIAAFAVPIAMVITPMAASADVPDDLAAYEDVSGSIATEDGAGLISETPFDDLEGAYATEEGSATFQVDDEDAHEDEGVNDVYVLEDEDEDFTETSTEAVATLTDHSTVDGMENDADVYDASYDTSYEATDNDDYDADYKPHANDYGSWNDESTTFATYDATSAFAGDGGAWTNSVESGAMSIDNGFGYHYGYGSDTATWYEQTSAAAGQGGAFVESIESSAMTGNDMGWAHGWNDDSQTWAEFEHTSSGAGEGGAWVSSTSSAAGELD